MRLVQIGPAARGIEQLGERRIEMVAHAAEEAEALDDLALPAGDVGDQLLEHPRRALAPPVVDRLGDIDAAAALVERRHHAGRDQIADVRDRPVVAEIDERVVPQPIVAAPQRRGLLRDQLDERAHRAGPLGDTVLVPVDRGQHLPELLLVVALVAIVGMVVGHDQLPVTVVVVARSKYEPTPGATP
ncbi:MAG: hypothetical protein E6J91_37570 [Deltaproteobacteria bacterium]|nr:MAG: hypothetical protein E6J91_37570 [Deltaproteobacteria bacterium]